MRVFRRREVLEELLLGKELLLVPGLRVLVWRVRLTYFLVVIS